MRRLMCGVFVMAIFSFAPDAKAAGPADGKWTARVMRAAPAAPQDLEFTLATDDGGKVTGTYTIVGTPQTPIEWGFVKGNLIVFKVKMPFGDQVVNFVYIGMVDGDAIAFGRRPEDLSLGRLVELTANRVK